MADKIALKSDSSKETKDTENIRREQSNNKPVTEELADLDIDGKNPSSETPVETAPIKPIETKKSETPKEKPTEPKDLTENIEKISIGKPKVQEVQELKNIKDKIESSSDIGTSQDIKVSGKEVEKAIKAKDTSGYVTLENALADLSGEDVKKIEVPEK